MNPATRAGNMGSEEKKEMLFWTKGEYLKFIDAMMDKPPSFYAFEMLYWCGIREGELFALTPADFDFTGSTVSINKSYQRLEGQDIITTPKTKKSNRKEYWFGDRYIFKYKKEIFDYTKLLEKYNIKGEMIMKNINFTEHLDAQDMIKIVMGEKGLSA